MDLEDSPDEAAFRCQVRDWLRDNVPSAQSLAGLDPVARSKLWQQRKYDAGWACLRWPKEYGGRGASAIEQVIWNQEEARVDAPANIFLIGQGMAAPTLMTWATEAQKRRYLPKLASGEEIWCQLFSEPGAGSDVAGLRTRAERDGDDWVLNGQKIWTSGAHYADFGIIVVRTDPDVDKHAGLSFFFLSMRSPGIETRPIRQISGAANFNEVWFDDVRVPDAQRLGAVGQGWQVALTTLMNERAAVGASGGAGVEQALALAQRVHIGARPALDDGHVRARLADWYCQESGLRFTNYRSLTALARGQTPGPESSIGKLVWAANMQDLASFCIDLMGSAGSIADPDVDADAARLVAAFMNAPGMRVAGGTDEIMLNVLAERVLGLPQEPRVDKGVPFSQLPSGRP